MVVACLCFWLIFCFTDKVPRPTFELHLMGTYTVTYSISIMKGQYRIPFPPYITEQGIIPQLSWASKLDYSLAVQCTPACWSSSYLVCNPIRVISKFTKSTPGSHSITLFSMSLVWAAGVCVWNILHRTGRMMRGKLFTLWEVGRPSLEWSDHRYT